MKKILVTGNMGYVGPVTIAGLRSANPDAEIIGYDCGLFASNLTSRAPLPERSAAAATSLAVASSLRSSTTVTASRPA